MTYLLTRESARSAGACYKDERIAELVPPEGLTLAQVVKLHIPLADIVWFITQAMGLPDRILRLSAVDSARRALSRVADSHPDSIAALDVAERHAHGLATDEELAAAAESARAWAWSVAWAWSAVWSAAAWAAAREAAREAAARAAAEAGAKDEERRAQIATLVRLVEEGGQA